MAGEIKVAYWKIRGLGAPCRMICAYAQAPYEAVLYDVQRKEEGDKVTWDRSEWFSVKPPLQEKNPLMNLPYVISGETVVTQSNSCLTFLGRQLKLNGANDAELTLVEQVVCQAFDLRNDCVKHFYGPADVFLQALTAHTIYINHYKKFEAWFALHKFSFTAANTPTTGDFPLWELLDELELAALINGLPSPLANYPNLLAFYQRVKALPTLQAYFQSDLFLALPCNQPFSSFGKSWNDAPK